MSSSFVALDVGEKRIGVAVADSAVRIAIPYVTIPVDGNEIKEIYTILEKEGADTLVIGYPRNQAGEATQQTASVEAFVSQIEDAAATIVYQDESLTSVMAEQRLESYKKPYERGEIDSMAASIILQDYLEAHHG